MLSAILGTSTNGSGRQILPLHDIVPAAISHFFILLPQEKLGIYSRNEIVITVDHPDTTDVFSNGKLEYPVSLRIEQGGFKEI